MRSFLQGAAFAALSTLFACANAGDTPGELPGDIQEQRQPGKVWITVGSDAVPTIQAMADSADVAAFESRDGVTVMQVSEERLNDFSRMMHDDFHRCSGYIVHDTYQGAAASLSSEKADRAMKASLVTYTIDNAAVVQSLISGVNATNILNNIDALENFPSRYYTRQSGVDAAHWIRDLWLGYASGRTDTTVELFSHPTFPQPSVIMTITGTTFPNEVVVIGGHLDSTVSSSPSTNNAPGADDDASGIATLSETARVLLSSGFRPQRTVKFMAYAAEEVGLRGSGAIANNYASNNINVIGVMQLDMTNYKGSVEDIALLSDYTNAAQNTFIGNLIDTYLDLNWVYTQCGYGCSDHASWTNAGFAASMPFEARFGQHNPNIHTGNDTLTASGNNANHAAKFARLAAAYVGELAKGGFGENPPPPPPPPPPSTKTEQFSGTVSRNQERHYGPFAVQSGTNFTAALTGNGDADLYVRFGAAPTTSSYACRPYQSGTNETCNLAVPSGQTQAYVMVRGYASSSTYSLNVTYTPASGGGTPSGTTVTQNFTDSVALQQSKQHGPFAVLPSTTFRAVMAPQTGNTGDGDLYVRYGAAPTLSTYDCRPYKNGSNETCELTVPSGQSQAYIMVYGYSAAAYTLSVTHTQP